MKFISLAVFLFCCSYSLHAQTPSTYDNNGKVKSVETRRYEESRNKQNSYTPAKTPATAPRSTATGYTPAASSQQYNSPGPELKFIIFEERRYYYYGDWDENGLLAVERNNKKGFINKEGKEIIPVKYDVLGKFKNGQVEVKIRGSYSERREYYNKAGEKLTEFVYNKTNSNTGIKPSNWLGYDTPTYSTAAVSDPKLLTPDPITPTKIPGSITLVDWSHSLAEIKIYKIIKINTQNWMAENLDGKYFRNGDPIGEARTKEEWKNAEIQQKPAWCYYDNDTNNVKYGKIYNWYAVKDKRGLAPVGSHIPTSAEWQKVSDYLGGGAITDNKMKATSGWNGYLGNGNNESGFTGLPGGFRTVDGVFSSIGDCGCWWTSSEETLTDGSKKAAPGVYLQQQ